MTCYSELKRKAHVANKKLSEKVIISLLKLDYMNSLLSLFLLVECYYGNRSF